MWHIIVIERNHLTIEPCINLVVMAEKIEWSTVDRLEVEDFIVSVFLTDG